jgi:hypothetical protein
LRPLFKNNASFDFEKIIRKGDVRTSNGLDTSTQSDMAACGVVQIVDVTSVYK